MTACSIRASQTLGGGAILAGLVLGGDRRVRDRHEVRRRPPAFALAGAVLTFFGFMHGEAIGIAVTPSVAVAYLIVAVFLFALSALSGPGAGANRIGPGIGLNSSRIAGGK